MNWTWTFPKRDHSFRPALAAQKNLLSFWNGVDTPLRIVAKSEYLELQEVLTCSLNRGELAPGPGLEPG